MQPSIRKPDSYRSEATDGDTLLYHSTTIRSVHAHPTGSPPRDVVVAANHRTAGARFSRVLPVRCDWTPARKHHERQLWRILRILAQDRRRLLCRRGIRCMLTHQHYLSGERLKSSTRHRPGSTVSSVASDRHLSAVMAERCSDLLLCRYIHTITW